MKKALAILGSLGIVFALLAWKFLEIGPPQSAYEKVLEEAEITTMMAKYGVPGVSFGIIKDGKLDWAKGYGVLQSGSNEKVDAETLFSVGSISKVGAAIISLKLQEEKQLDIDVDVNEYLVSWQVPENQFTLENPVTLRRIMSHTAGLTVHGFADFGPGEALPTTVQVLNGEGPAKNPRVFVDVPIGSMFRYSGGGTTVEQMIIEDLTNQPFFEAAQKLLFEPLGMERSSYENPLPTSWGNIAKAHNRAGTPVALPRGYQSMPEAAASGLWTNPTDLSKLMIMLMQAYKGEDSYLHQSTVADMMTPVHPSNFGLGPRISNEAGDLRFRHGGANDSYRARFIGSMTTQNGMIIFTNGTAGNDLINELVAILEPLVF